MWSLMVDAILFCVGPSFFLLEFRILSAMSHISSIKEGGAKGHFRCIHDS
jgi:hypothetical protein